MINSIYWETLTWHEYLLPSCHQSAIPWSLEPLGESSQLVPSVHCREAGLEDVMEKGWVWDLTVEHMEVS